MRRRRRELGGAGGASTAVVLIGLALAPEATAGGLFVPLHGARGAGRAGAYFAGGDDPGAIWYNPAAIDRVRSWQLLLDATMLFNQLRFARVDSGGNVLPEVKNEGAPLPVPTLAGVVRAWRRRVWVGFSFSAPLAGAPRFPRPSYGPCGAGAPARCIDTVHTDAPQRYGVISLVGTYFLRLELAVAVRVLPRLTVGLSLQNVFARLRQLKSITSYNGTLSGGPEDPDFDSLNLTQTGDMFCPTARLGVSYRPHPMLTLAAVAQLPTWIDAGGTIAVQLPVSPVYDGSTVDGDRGRVRLEFPLSLALAAELQLLGRGAPGRSLRIELALVWEAWSMLEALHFEPDGIVIRDLPGIGDYLVGPIDEVLDLRDALSLRLGVEYRFARVPLTLRAGYAFERGATRPRSVSLVAVDRDKHLLTAGASGAIGRFRLDLFYGLMLVPDLEVDYREAKAPQINPLAPESAVAVGGGKYRQLGHLAGLGLNVSF